MSNSKSWHVIYSKPRCEKKVDAALLQKGIESWCPLYKIKKQWSDRKKIIEEPLFKSYVFIRINFDEEKEKILNTQGVLSFVYYNRSPAIVKDKEINEIKSYLAIDNVDITLTSLDAFKKDMPVRITRGLFKNAQGKVLRDGKKRVFVQLESLGQVMTIEFGVENLEHL